MFGFEIAIYWKWFILALVLMALEVMAPGVFLLWFGLSALVTGAVAYVFPDAISLQFATFAIVSGVTLYFVNKFFKKKQDDEEGTLNLRAKQYVGKKFEYVDGKIKVGDGWWLVVSDDFLKNGDIVEVYGEDGNALKVKKV
ncbi:MAG: Inner membrane protein YbbJ [Alphaproteobacteria bacterium ADurb.Bin438]|nr:MAG: Inner membrane protein YbbJ [Alphaproteobacteria bacterium ADurb.Bin438]